MALLHMPLLTSGKSYIKHAENSVNKIKNYQLEQEENIVSLDISNNINHWLSKVL